MSIPGPVPPASPGPTRAPRRGPLPIDSVLGELVAAVQLTGAAVLEAPTGAGKTTRVPPALLALSPLDVVVVEPRRVAARAAALRMSEEAGTPLGGLAGYHVRFDRQVSGATRIRAVTPGIFLRYLLADPLLERTGAVVLDEFHERGLEQDLALGLIRLARTVRPELRLVVMSATLESGPLAEYLSRDGQRCSVVRSLGRSFPVEVRHRPAPPANRLIAAAVDAVAESLAESPGDVLAFLPGVREIRACLAEFGARPASGGVLALPLYGDLGPAEQDAALRPAPGGGRRVVFATNVAEASVTAEGVTAVIDTGLSRQSEFDPALGINRLTLAPISRASADQRAGRAGRTRPGVCVRLWDEPSHRARLAQTPPEVRRVELSGALLLLRSLGERDFDWLEAPRPESVAQAESLLQQLGLTDGERRITPLGSRAAGLPLPPRLGRMLLEAEAQGCAPDAALVAALLTERDPFEGRPSPGPTECDYLWRLAEIRRRPRDPEFAPVLRAARQYEQLFAPPAGSPNPDALLRCILAAYPDRLVRRRGPGELAARMVGGRGVRFAPTSGVSSELAIAIDCAAGEAESPVRAASEVRREFLDSNRLTARTQLSYDAAADRLTARKLTLYIDLVLDDVPGHISDEASAARVLAGAAVESWPKAFPDADSPAGQLVARLRCLAAWQPEAGWPAFDDSAFQNLLGDLCHRRRSLAEVRSAPWADAILASLSGPQLTRLRRDAPEELAVPSGRSVRLAYEVGKPPVLAVKIQELFGLATTPAVAGGRVKVLLHLLAPNGRVQQITADLASFWANGYPVLRKELRGRYPRHPWPDDPLSAPATGRAKPRGT